MVKTEDIVILRRKHASGWRCIMAYGLLLVGIGVLALLRPVAASLATGLFVGVILTVGGITAVMAGIAKRGWHSPWLDVVVGILSILLGLLIFRNPFAGALSLIWLIAVWAIVIGALELTAAARLPFGRGWLVFVGAVNVLLGAGLILAGPAAGMVFLALLVGMSFIVRGSLVAAFAWHLRGAMG